MKKQKSFAVCMETSANSAAMNAASIKQGIARNVRRHVKYVQINAGKWQLKVIRRNQGCKAHWIPFFISLSPGLVVFTKLLNEYAA